MSVIEINQEPRVASPSAAFWRTVFWSLGIGIAIWIVAPRFGWVSPIKAFVVGVVLGAGIGVWKIIAERRYRKWYNGEHLPGIKRSRIEDEHRRAQAGND